MSERSPRGQAREIASSMASLVPEPIEKGAGGAAAPSRTRFSWRQDALRTVVKLIHCDLLAISRWPSSTSANSSEQAWGGSARSAPARRHLSSVVSTMNVELLSLYG